MDRSDKTSKSADEKDVLENATVTYVDRRRQMSRLQNANLSTVAQSVLSWLDYKK